MDLTSSTVSMWSLVVTVVLYMCKDFDSRFNVVVLTVLNYWIDKSSTAILGILLTQPYIELLDSLPRIFFFQQKLSRFSIVFLELS